MNIRPFVPLLALLAAACEPAPEKPPLPKTDPPPQSRLPPGVRDEMDALAKAKKADATIQQRAAKEDAAIRRQSE
jgi:hypothetical protein